jgi:cell wall-associated NlpC family hydrolase
MADTPFDPRVTPARREVAARHLEGKVAAARYIDGETVAIAAPLASIHASPSASSEQISQALLGERMTIYDRQADGWAWGQLSDDNYVGWIADSALRSPSTAPTHCVRAQLGFAYRSASIKTPPLATLPFGARLVATGEDNGFAVTADGWFVPLQHIHPIESFETDFVAVAERFVGTPYLWGGKSAMGIDCSGLVQIALHACGEVCPRDSDMQQVSLGRALPLEQPDRVQRGDLVFWKGHIAIARDSETLVHANAFHLATAIERTRDAVARIAAEGSNVLAVRRLR